MKYVVILGDGMADTPVPALNGLTPLDAARHPAMDRLACDGEYGMARTIPEGMKPGSDTANLAVFGYDPRVYYTGRSPLEAVSLGIPLRDDDVTYRCNFVTVSDPLSIERGTMIDYSAGELSTGEARELVTFLNEALSDETARLHPGFSYRQCMVLAHGTTGAQLSQPHDLSGKPLLGQLPGGENAALLRRWMERAGQLLFHHPVNQKRMAAGQNPANMIWFWGEGTRPALTDFKQKTGLSGAVVSAVDLLQGIGCCAGMRVLKVPGATGTFETNFSGKAQAAMDALHDGCDFVYVHIEAPDECGHRGQVREKVYSIEQIDRQVLGPILSALDESGEDYAVLLMPDHPTPLEKLTHTADPVPFALYRKGCHAGRNVRYCERDAAGTGLFVDEGWTLLERMLHGA